MLGRLRVVDGDAVREKYLSVSVLAVFMYSHGANNLIEQLEGAAMSAMLVGVLLSHNVFLTPVYLNKMIRKLCTPTFYV